MSTSLGALRRAHSGAARLATTARRLAALVAAAAAVVVAGLPGCTLNRTAIAPPVVRYNVTSVLRTSDGREVPITSDDMLFAGGAPRVTAESDTPFGRDSLLADWRRYLRRRLEDPAASPEFRARFGGPAGFCLVSLAALATTERVPPADVPAAETGPEVPDCPPPTASDCGNPPGVLPTVSVTPTEVDFGELPVGTASAPVDVTVANTGVGRLCLAAPMLDAALSPQAGDYSVDATDCVPRTPEELGLGLAVLAGGVRPSCRVRVTFTAGGEGARDASLRISSSDPSRSTWQVPLVGKGNAGAVVGTDPLCFNVPPVAVPGRGPCYPNTAGIRNDGPGRVTLRSVALPAAAMAAGWEIVALRPAAVPITLEPGQTLFVDLRACSATAPDTLLSVAGNGAPPTLDLRLQGPMSACMP